MTSWLKPILIGLAILSIIGIIACIVWIVFIKKESLEQTLEQWFVRGYNEEVAEAAERKRYNEGDLNWKYTTNDDDIDCLKDWDYYAKDAKTIIKSKIFSTTTNKDKSNSDKELHKWCATKSNTTYADRTPKADSSSIVYDAVGLGLTAAAEVIASKLSKEAAEKAAKEAAEKAAKEAAEKAAKEAAEKATKEATEKAAKEAAEKATKEATEKATKEAAEKAAKEAAEKAAKEAAEKAAKEAAEKATKEAAEKAAQESLERVAREAAEKATLEAAEKAAKEAIVAFRLGIMNFSKTKLVPKIAFKIQSKQILTISKALSKNKNMVVNLAEQLAKMAKGMGKMTYRVGIKSSIKIISKASAFIPGPLAMLDILNFVLDVADVGGYNKMQTKQELLNLKSANDTDWKTDVYNEIKKSLNGINIPFEIEDFEWPIVVDPTDDFFDDITLNIMTLENISTIMATSDSDNPDPAISTYITTLNNDIKSGVITIDDLNNSDVMEKYMNLIDDDAIVKRLMNTMCLRAGGIIYDGDKCTLSAEKCNTSYSWPLKPDDIYTEFKDGKCVQANPQMRQTCDKMKTQYDSSTGICVVDKNYCSSKGADWTFNKKINDYDCSVSATQKVLEAVTGTTMIRTLKKLILSDTLTQPITVPNLVNSAVMGIGYAVADSLVENKRYDIGPIKIAGKCLDVKDGKHPKLQIWDCNGSDSQKFVYDESTGRILFKGIIKNNTNNYSQCIEIPNNDLSNGTQIHVNNCVGIPSEFKDNDNQMLFYNPSTNQIRFNSIKCLDLINENNANGNNFQLMDCKDIDAQKFYIPKIKVSKNAPAIDFSVNYRGYN